MLNDTPTVDSQLILNDGTAPFVAEPGRFDDPAKALSFILAGNAYFTVRSEKTGTRYTYRVSTPKDGEPTQWGRKYFVSLLTGPENSHDYTYLGMMQRNRFRLTRVSRMNDKSGPVVAFVYVLHHLADYEQMPPQCEIWHEGRCGGCGRMLTVPESIAAGIGPDCATREKI